MPLDLSAYKKHIADARTTQKDPHAWSLQDLAVQIVEQRFPDYVIKGSAKVVADYLPNSVGGTYVALGDKITLPSEDRARNAPMKQVDTDLPVWAKKDGKWQVVGKDGQRANFATAEVLDQVQTLLHEIIHNRTSYGPGFNAGSQAAKAVGLTKEDEATLMRINNAADVRLSSQNSKTEMNWSEFIAEAASLLDMKDRNLITTDYSRPGHKLRTLEKMVAEVPKLADAIEQMRTPDAGELKSFNPGLMESVKNMVSNLLSSNSKQPNQPGSDSAK